MILLLLIFLLFNWGCGPCCCVGGVQTTGYVQYGLASYYGDEFHGRKTASGETFNKWAYTCAHKKLPFGTRVKVTNLKNKKTVIVRVNDRGPFVKGRIIDLSYAAAKKIDLVKYGVVKVKIEVVK
ncbi:MAG TPA: septal ring lytic transglycosylase RlpA family protein [candidate division WOR-3 bacterium]|uniref:Probable endolytic peptidoglycan transglycosylase RlpA n=1 Tax=candidate division WOR-3 bacterium TaxID=2052148 RepID=A0A9C9EMG0_UNCW3|nr:septal ring lytic transglycosylase RlpA family protein [candidate division WOR-3 bacterium]